MTSGAIVETRNGAVPGSGGVINPPALDFDLHADNNWPTGITFANGRLYVINSSDNIVYSYSVTADTGTGDQPEAVDRVVGSPTVTDGSPETGERFTSRVTVRNQGGDRSAPTTLRYSRSSNASISTSDVHVGTDSVRALAALRASAESISLAAPSAEGTYYYGACVEGVSGEADSNWQRRANADSAWEDIPATEATGSVCSYTPSASGQYRGAA